MSRFMQNKKENVVYHYHKEDVLSMFKNLRICSFQQKDFENVRDIYTQQHDDFRITLARYGIENVCRTTLINPSLPIEYIESRLTPYQDFGGEQDAPAKEILILKFRSQEDTRRFSSMLDSDQRTINPRYGKDRFWSMRRPLANLRANIVTINNGDSKLLLTILSEQNTCTSLIVEQHVNAVITQDQTHCHSQGQDMAPDLFRLASDDESVQSHAIKPPIAELD